MLNSSLTISLGAGASDVSWGANANSREEVSMATLKAGPPLKQPLTDTITLNKIQWRYLPMIILTWERKESYKKETNPPSPSKGGRRGSKNPQRFTRAKLIRYDQQAKQQSKNSMCHEHKRHPAKPQGPPCRSHSAIEETAGQLCSSLLCLNVI